MRLLYKYLKLRRINGRWDVQHLIAAATTAMNNEYRVNACQMERSAESAAFAARKSHGSQPISNWTGSSLERSLTSGAAE